MRFIRKSLILIHRYLGIVFSLLFLMWFVSGIAMIYARSMPALTSESRLEHLPVLNPSLIRLSPAEAFAKSGAFAPPAGATLLTILNRPAYRFGGRGGSTVFADNGELFEMNAEQAAEAARLFTNLREDQLHPAGVLTAPDQWTLLERGALPMHRFTVDDDARTELYVSERTGEVAVLTTRASRSLAWIAAIPHWMYFEALRTKPQTWRKVVLWSSGLATISALIGLILGFIQYRRKRPHIPYAGWLRWHYITGVIFGIFTLTWVFSGFLSMEPWFWASDGGLGDGIRESLQGGELDLTKFPVAVPPIIPGAKEVEYLTIQGAPYYRIQTAGPKRILFSAPSLRVRTDLFSTESLLARLTAANPEVKVLETTLLEDYDSYYYSFGREAPLPVLRVKFDDPDSTWLYVDPKMSAVVGRAHRRERLQRWIYHGFHSLDFSFWYYNRPLWDIAMVGLSLGGITLSMIGVVIAWKRVSRAVVRSLR
jgi:PepSY-associated TM region